MRRLRFKTTQAGWEGMNEFLATQWDALKEKDGAVTKGQAVSYTNYIIMKKAWVDPEFDFGKMFGYTIRKWTSLVSNYVNLHELDALRNKVLEYELKSSPNYTAHMHFTNSHKSGKECLISLTLCKEPKKKAAAYFHVRAGELTKRVLIDFLLIQRILEYIYNDNNIEVHYIAPMVYITAENFVMYHGHKDLHKLLAPHNTPMTQRILEVLDNFSNVDPSTIKYKVNLRAVNQLQKDKEGNPLSGKAPMLAKSLHLW